MQTPTVEDMKSRLTRAIGTAKNLGASAAKLTFGKGKNIHCSFEAGRLKATGQKETLSYSIEVVVNGRKGNTSGNRLQEMDSLIEQAIILAKEGSTAHFDAYPAPGEVVGVATYSDRTLSLTREQLIQSCQQTVDMLKAHNSDLFISCSAKRIESEGLLVTSGGVCHHSRRTHWQLGAFVQRTQSTEAGPDMLFSGHGRSWCDLNEFYDPKAIAEKILTDLRWAQNISEAPRGKVKTYLPPETVAQLLWPIFMGTNGRNVAKGDSPLATRLNQSVLSEALTIFDDPHQPYASGTCAIDHDGIATQRQTIFEKGVLKRFLYDLDSAGLANANPTGNDGCAPYSPHILPGAHTSAELLAQIEDGLYIRDVIGFGQGNVINGDFSVNIGLGYRIKNGEIAGRVKNTMIAGNLYEIFKGNVLVSSDTDYEGCYPHLVVDGVNVSGQSKGE